MRVMIRCQASQLMLVLMCTSLFLRLCFASFICVLCGCKPLDTPGSHRCSPFLCFRARAWLQPDSRLTLFVVATLFTFAYLYRSELCTYVDYGDDEGSLSHLCSPASPRPQPTVLLITIIESSLPC
ncbi:hypothetical protein IW262DRAFT_174993 [Armillaria fumosa]|nr:hypothetical protein IW262DRAFT_174993 [Armillaria fumosa]